MTMKSGFAGPKHWPCCGPTAVATALELPFPLVLETMRELGKRNENWKGTSNFPERAATLHHFGAIFKTSFYRTKRNKLRFWQWALLHSKPGVMYVIDIPGHTFAFKDMMLIDQDRIEPTHFALLNQIGSASIDSATEILSIPSSVSRNHSAMKAENELKELF